VSNTLNIIKRNITKQTILINTNKTNLLLLLLLQQIQKRLSFVNVLQAKQKKQIEIVNPILVKN